jgi:hypothetical protein
MDSQVKSHFRNLNNIADFNFKCGILTQVTKNKTSGSYVVFDTARQIKFRSG